MFEPSPRVKVEQMVLENICIKYVLTRFALSTWLLAMDYTNMAHYPV